mgnify:FL=1
MKTKRPITALLRANGFAHAVALAAMVLQVVFATAHLGSGAARVAGNVPVPGSLGFMEICTGAGFARVPIGTSGAQSGDATTTCPVCASACVLSFDQAASVAEPVPPVLVAVDSLLSLAHVATRHQRALSDGPARAPPAVIV